MAVETRETLSFWQGPCLRQVGEICTGCADREGRAATALMAYGATRAGQPGFGFAKPRCAYGDPFGVVAVAVEVVFVPALGWAGVVVVVVAVVCACVDEPWPLEGAGPCVVF